MKKYLGDKNYFMVAMVVLGVVLVSVIFGNNAFATEASLTITLSSSNVSANVAPFADSTGTFVQSEAINVGVTTDNVTGYDLKIKANDNTYPERLINSTDNSYLSSISTATNLATFKATDLSSITTSGGNQGAWGYMPSKLNSTANTLFQPTPGTAGHTIEQTSASNSTANTYTISLGAKVSPLATVGAYTNSFVITAVGNPIPYTITYSENIVSGMPDNVIDGTSGSTSVTISSTTPTRAGYRFLGWCDQATTKSGDTDTCATGHDYQPGGTLTLDATGANNVKLYAMWAERNDFDKAFANAGKTKQGDYYKMQDASSAICSAVDTGETGQLLDTRGGGTVYSVAKLADGKCWMVENLNIAGGTALSADDTDVTSAYISSFSTSNNLTKAGNTIVLPASSTSGFDTNNYSYVYNSGNKTNCGASGQDTPCYSYYSWDAATLGSGRTIATENTDAPQSICPKGWRLPKSGAETNNGWKRGDFYALAAAYGANLESSYSENSATFYNNAGPGTTPNFLLAGFYSDGSFWGSSGFYWSSTSYYSSISYSSTWNARHLYFNLYDNEVNSAGFSFRKDGFSVRCLFSGQ